MRRRRGRRPPRGTKRRDATPVTAALGPAAAAAGPAHATHRSLSADAPAGGPPGRSENADASPAPDRPRSPRQTAAIALLPAPSPSAQRRPRGLPSGPNNSLRPSDAGSGAPTATESRRASAGAPCPAPTTRRAPARTPALQAFPATPLTATKFAVAAVAPHLPRCQHPLLFRRAGRDPASDPFGDAFNMPWLEWEKYLPGARDGPGILAGGVDVDEGGMVFGPRRGILRL